MKNPLRKLFALCAIVCGLVVTANAQDAVSPAKMTPDQKLEMRLGRMKTNLNLSDAQVAQVKPLVQSEMTARESGDKQQMQDAHEKMKTEMAKILTPDQMTKYNQMTSRPGGRMNMNGSQPGK